MEGKLELRFNKIKSTGALYVLLTLGGVIFSFPAEFSGNLNSIEQGSGTLHHYDGESIKRIITAEWEENAIRDILSDRELEYLSVDRRDQLKFKEMDTDNLEFRIEECEINEIFDVLTYNFAEPMYYYERLGKSQVDFHFSAIREDRLYEERMLEAVRKGNLGLSPGEIRPISSVAFRIFSHSGGKSVDSSIPELEYIFESKHKRKLRRRGTESSPDTEFTYFPELKGRSIEIEGLCGTDFSDFQEEEDSYSQNRSELLESELVCGIIINRLGVESGNGDMEFISLKDRNHYSGLSPPRPYEEQI
jgi:hypothetical protein